MAIIITAAAIAMLIIGFTLILRAGPIPEKSESNGPKQ